MKHDYDLDIIGLGALNTDHIYQVTRTTEDGESLAMPIGAFPGGSAANTIYGLAKLGLATGFIGVVGEDEQGRGLMDSFREVGVDTSQIRSVAHRSGQTLCFSDNAGRRSIYILPGANDFLSQEDIDTSYLSRARLVHVSSFARNSQWTIISNAILDMPPLVKLSFSPGSLYASIGLKAMGTVLERTTVLFVNRTEITEMTGANIFDGAQACIDAGCKIVVVTLGKGIKVVPEGRDYTCYVRSATQEHLVATPELKVANVEETTGCGDAFAAGFLYGLLSGKPLLDCAHLAVASASFCLTQPGARTGLPTKTELIQRYRALSRKL